MDELTLLREFRSDVEACDELGESRARAALGADLAAEAGRPWPRWVRFVALAVILGAGLGFGLATWLTPSGSATSSFAGFGFLPAKGWTVVQSGTIGATGRASAIAANVPLDPADRLGAPPYATLEALPSHGVVIAATFTTRGDPAADAGFRVRELPLRLADAKALPAERELLPLARRLAVYRLRAGVEGYNVEARIFVGTASPSPELLAAVQKQLNRLVVAAERVTIFARPTILGPNDSVTLFGSIDSDKADEVVNIQAKDCGQRFFRGVGAARTRQGGGWSKEHWTGISTTFRAVWSGASSAQITVRRRPLVNFRRLPPGRQFEVSVVAQASFWRKRILLHRFDRRLGTWATVKSIVLTDTGAAGAFARSTARFSTSLPRGTLVRMFFPLSQARPCYLAGVSPQLRT